MKKNRRQIASPCKSICRLNEEDICEGCGRTKKEIQDWKIYSDKRRSMIMDKLSGADSQP